MKQGVLPQGFTKVTACKGRDGKERPLWISSLSIRASSGLFVIF
jgi:hypothetical protein